MAKSGYGNVVIEITSSWRGAPHVWRSTANHSGGAFTTEADQIAYLQSYFGVILLFISSSDLTSFVSGVKYYDGINSVPRYEAAFVDEAAAHAAGFGLGGTGVTVNQGEAFSTATGGQGLSGLECCTVLQAPIGISSTGKPVYMKKWIHCAPASGSENDMPPFNSFAAGYAGKLGDGTMFGSRVLVSPTGKQGPWTTNLYFGNHQMPRRRKTASSGSSSSASSILSQLEKAFAAKGALNTLEEILDGL